MAAQGYLLRIREPDWHQHRLLKGPDTNVNLHVFSAGSVEIDRMLTFRDLLRTNPAARERYAATKRDLARRTWKYVQNYADAKSEVVETLLASAQRSSAGKSKSAVPPRSPVDVDGPEGVRGSRSSNPESPTGIDGLGGGTPGRRVRLRTDTEP